MDYKIAKKLWLNKIRSVKVMENKRDGLLLV